MNLPVSVEHLKTLLERHSLEGLLVTGYIDDGSTLRAGIRPQGRFGRFSAFWNEVYLEVGPVLLRFKAIASYSHLLMEQVEKIECSFDIDPDDTFGVTSMLRDLLPSGLDSVRIRQIDVYADSDEPSEPGVVTAIGLATDQGEYLFFDPLDINGIHVGPLQSKELWLEWRAQRHLVKSYTLGI